MWVTKQLLVPTGFDNRNKIWKSLGSSNYLVTHILQNNFYIQQKKETHSGLKQLESE